MAQLCMLARCVDDCKPAHTLRALAGWRLQVVADGAAVESVDALAQEGIAFARAKM